MKRSETPRVDALVQIIEGGHEYAPRDALLALARQLERELAAAAVPLEPTELMVHAYRLALRKLIDSVPKAQRRWPQDAHGYVIPEREKAAARWKAMLEAARREARK